MNPSTCERAIGRCQCQAGGMRHGPEAILLSTLPACFGICGPTLMVATFASPSSPLPVPTRPRPPHRCSLSPSSSFPLPRLLFPEPSPTSLLLLLRSVPEIPRLGSPLGRLHRVIAVSTAPTPPRTPVGRLPAAAAGPMARSPVALSRLWSPADGGGSGGGDGGSGRRWRSPA